MQQADIIGFHCPLADETKNLIAGAAFSQIEDGTILINVARGGVVDEMELAKTLLSGKSRGASLDGLYHFGHSGRRALRINLMYLSMISSSGNLPLATHHL